MPNSQIRLLGVLQVTRSIERREFSLKSHWMTSSDRSAGHEEPWRASFSCSSKCQVYSQEDVVLKAGSHIGGGIWTEWEDVEGRWWWWRWGLLWPWRRCPVTTGEEPWGLWLLSLPPDVTIQLLQLMRREDSPRQEGLLRVAGGGGRGQRVECVDSNRTLVGCVNTRKRLQ